MRYLRLVRQIGSSVRNDKSNPLKIKLHSTYFNKFVLLCKDIWSGVIVISVLKMIYYHQLHRNRVFYSFAPINGKGSMGN